MTSNLLSGKHSKCHTFPRKFNLLKWFTWGIPQTPKKYEEY